MASEEPRLETGERHVLAAGEKVIEGDCAWFREVEGFSYGDEDLERALRLLPTRLPRVVCVEKNGGRQYFLCHRFSRCEKMDQKWANEDLELFNGIGTLAFDRFHGLRIGPELVIFKWNYPINLLQVRSAPRPRSRWSTELGASPTLEAMAVDPDAVLDAALRSEPLSRALRLIGDRTVSWAGLYHAFEIVEGHIGNVQLHGWVGRRELERFTRTANHPVSAGIAARHGRSKSVPPQQPMTIAEGRSIVRAILQHWMTGAD